MNQSNKQEDFGEQLNRLEEAWFEAERKLKELQRFTKSGIWEYDWSDGSVWMSAEMYRLYKIEESSELITNKGALPFIHPDDVETVRAAFQNAVKEKQVFRITHRAVLLGGEIRYLEQVGDTTYHEDGTPNLTTGITQDITDKQMVLLNLHDSEFKFRDLFAQSAYSVSIVK